MINLLQSVSDANKMIRHIDPCWPGAVNDAFVFSDSIIKELGEEKALGENFFLGDSGYIFMSSKSVTYIKAYDKEPAKNINYP